MVEKMKFKNLLDEVTKILGTNVKIAEYLGCDERTVYRWRSGESKPSHAFLSIMYDLVIKQKK